MITKIIEILPPSKVAVNTSGESPVKTALLIELDGDCVEIFTFTVNNKIYHTKHIHLDIKKKKTVKMIFVVRHPYRVIEPATAINNNTSFETLAFLDKTPLVMRK